ERVEPVLEPPDVPLSALLRRELRVYPQFERSARVDTDLHANVVPGQNTWQAPAEAVSHVHRDGTSTGPHVEDVPAGRHRKGPQPEGVIGQRDRDRRPVTAGVRHNGRNGSRTD